MTDSAGATQTSATVNTYIQNHTISPLAVSISASPTSSSASPIQLLDTGDCVTVTWTVTRSGGTSPYTTTIFVSGTGTSLGNGTSYSKTYCNTETNVLMTIPAYATVTDSPGTSKTSTTVNTYIQNNKPYVDPCPTCASTHP